MRKRVLLLVGILLLVFNATGFAAAPSTINLNQTIAGAPVATVIDKELRTVADMFGGFAAVDYATFSKDFTSELKTVFTPEVFKSAHKDTISKLGEFRGMDLLIWQSGEQSAVDTIIYRGRFAKDEQMTITVVLDSKNLAAIKVSKVIFESDLLQSDSKE